ncbi:cation:proton antiporter [Streptomyces sp. NA02950]|uniref:cation:proton antiporter n=1 Tax=Streptomyces sp. NA02950 TaxID=2742137 RepID=UPI00159193FC|nr:cation:proton antiporter [Streptomyces sp. NA02950]QKV90703.1 cation:proton antiporter [Streptomyces sp. NA02950]
MSDVLRWTVFAVLALIIVLATARLGAWLARLLRQPEVVGEISLGLLAGPLLVWAGGTGLRHVLFGDGRWDALNLVAHGGLVLFMVGVGHELTSGATAPRARPLVSTAIGALLAPAALGVGMAVWLQGQGSALRGTAPTPAFTLVLAVSLSVTAVPVLARILIERGQVHTAAARLALGAGALIDLVAWAVLALAIAIAGGGSVPAVLGRIGTLLSIGLLAALLAVALRRVPGGRSRTLSAVLIGVVALGLSLVAKVLGVNEILMALALGLAIPHDGRGGAWCAAVEPVTRVGQALVPVLFFVTGTGVFTSEIDVLPWLATGVALVLAIVGKVGGTYLGARAGGCSPHAALELGVLLNTRGLTELVVLQAAYAAGILPPALYLALVLMTLVTTAMTGPLHARMTRGETAGTETTGTETTRTETTGATTTKRETAA